MAKVGSKGQVVIDKAIRDRLGIQPGWLALQRLDGDRVEIIFRPPSDGRSLKGVLAPSIQGPGATGTTWEEIREAAWADAMRLDRQPLAK